MGNPLFSIGELVWAMGQAAPVEGVRKVGDGWEYWQKDRWHPEGKIQYAHDKGRGRGPCPPRLEGNPFILLELALTHLGNLTRADSVWVEVSEGMREVRLMRCDVDASPDGPPPTQNTVLVLQLSEGMVDTEDFRDYVRWRRAGGNHLSPHSLEFQLAVNVLTGGDSVGAIADLLKEKGVIP